MHVRRLTSVNDVVRNWEFLANGLTAVRRHLRYQPTIGTFRKTLFQLARRTDAAWLGVAYEDTSPVAFLIVHECTPLYAEQREFDASMYYHTSGYAIGITHLQREFDTFCRTQNIKRYYVTTRHTAGRPLPVFSIGWSGVKHAYRVYQKEL